MKTYVKATVLAAVLTVTSIGIYTAMAQEPSTDKPAPAPTFRTPLVRDLELIDQVKALSARVADLEAKNADLTKRLTTAETKLATIKK